MLEREAAVLLWTERHSGTHESRNKVEGKTATYSINLFLQTYMYMYVISISLNCAVLLKIFNFEIGFLKVLHYRTKYRPLRDTKYEEGVVKAILSRILSRIPF
jgi:hypothetical protein